MKKYIAAFDGLRYSDGTEQYAIQLAKICKAHLVGVFLDDFMRHTYGVADVVEYEGSFDQHVKELNAEDELHRKHAVNYFKEHCEEAGIQFSIHRDRNVAIQELLHESVFADLLLINESETLTRYEEESPSRFLRELLADVQCPVIVVPDNYEPIQKVIFLYDGEPCSVYAIKMFNYLFPELDHLQFELLSVKQDESLHLTDGKLLKEFMKRHYPDAVYSVVQGYPEDAVLKYLSGQEKNCLIVTGAYRRSRISRWVHRSMADTLIRNQDFPVFVAHNKT